MGPFESLVEGKLTWRRGEFQVRVVRADRTHDTRKGLFLLMVFGGLTLRLGFLA